MLSLAWKAAKRSWRPLRELPMRAAVALGSAGFGEPARPARFPQALAIVVPAAFLAWWLVPQMTIVMSPSIEAWAVRAAPGPIHRGDYVMFLLSHPLAGPKPVNVTKHALCLPGDHLTMVEKPSPMTVGARDGWYYCNGALLGVSKTFGHNGQRLEHFLWSGGPVPAGHAYVGSGNPNSFDSRYFGLVPLDRLTRMERVL